MKAYFRLKCHLRVAFQSVVDYESLAESAAEVEAASIPLHNLVVALGHEATDAIELGRCRPPGGRFHSARCRILAVHSRKKIAK